MRTSNASKNKAQLRAKQVFSAKRMSFRGIRFGAIFGDSEVFSEVFSEIFSEVYSSETEVFSASAKHS